MNLTLPATLCEAACRVLNEPSPAQKVALTRRFAAAWQQGGISQPGRQTPPERPARPARPLLKPPAEMPRRGKGGLAGKCAFIHAIAHIELNAIDLAWDIICRFTDEPMPRAFHDDWVGVAMDEANHFALLEARLNGLDAAYGDLPAHDGLWEAALTTKDDLLARLAVVPLILEARGLDTTPAAVARLIQAGDVETADLFRKIAEEEIPHVAAGLRWFEFLCARRGLAPIPTFHQLAASRYAGRLKPPFNTEARSQAGMDQAYYRTPDS
ncbi:MAG: ferritin-like domain-containing protein [Rhodospirillales bacterium]|nr:ferritin-like domain-containing protein [Rhodospirillales bacterium]